MSNGVEMQPVPSPCIGVCRMDERSGWCTGCLRTIDEIAAWSTMGPQDKRAVWALLESRRAPPETGPAAGPPVERPANGASA